MNNIPSNWNPFGLPPHIYDKWRQAVDGYGKNHDPREHFAEGLGGMYRGGTGIPVREEGSAPAMTPSLMPQQDPKKAELARMLGVGQANNVADGAGDLMQGIAIGQMRPPQPVSPPVASPLSGSGAGILPNPGGGAFNYPQRPQPQRTNIFSGLFGQR